MGPVEFLVIGFEGNKFSGEIVPEIRKLTEEGTIRILDFLFVSKDPTGAVAAVEPGELPGLQLGETESMKDDDEGWFSLDDVDDIGGSLQANSSVAMVLFEHSWAARLAETVRNANGQLIGDERIPARIADEIASGRIQRVGAGR